MSGKKRFKKTIKKKPKTFNKTTPKPDSVPKVTGTKRKAVVLDSNEPKKIKVRV